MRFMPLQPEESNVTVQEDNMNSTKPDYFDDPTVNAEGRTPIEELWHSAYSNLHEMYWHYDGPDDKRVPQGEQLVDALVEEATGRPGFDTLFATEELRWESASEWIDNADYSIGGP